MYDWLITIPRELQLFWPGHSATLSAVLYFITRLSVTLRQLLPLYMQLGLLSDDVRTDILIMHQRLPADLLIEVRNASFTSLQSASADP